MPKPQWSILENNFPLSINASVDRMKLRPGECSEQINISHIVDGVLEYAPSPTPSSNFEAKKFVAPGTVADEANELDRIYRFGRYWRVNLTEPKLEYTAIVAANTAGFTVDGSLDFSDDGTDRISMIVPLDDKWCVLKPKSATVVDNVAGTSDAFRKRTPYFGVGCSNPDSYYSNAVMARSVVTTWDAAGKTGPRHYMWDTRNNATELSRLVRNIAEAQASTVRAEVSWEENLVIAGNLVYDLEAKRVYHFTDSNYVTFTSRTYTRPRYKPITVHGFYFIAKEQEGQFKAEFLYSRDTDGTERSESRTIKVTKSGKRRFLHEWRLKNPVTTRAYRIKISELTGAGILSIGTLSFLPDSEHTWEDGS